MHIGERIGAYRKRKRIPQETLAGLVGRSRSWLSQVERGIRGVDRLSTINNLAAALQVKPADLVGHDWKYAPNGSPEVAAVAAIRAHLASYGHLLARPSESPPWPLPQLRAATVEVHRSYQAAKYGATARVLPDLLRAADGYDGFAGQSSREIHLARCMAYAAASKLLTKMGESELAWITADRASHAAMAADSDVARGLAAYQIACALHRAEQSDEAEYVAVGAAEHLLPLAASDEPDLVSLAGSNLLLASVIAAQRADRSLATERLTRAEQLSQLLAQDANRAWTAFGPTNVQIHRASVAAELGDPRAVIQEATMVDADRLPKGLHSRRVQVHLDLAWAQTQAHNDTEAVFHLHLVNRQAPEVTRYNTIARETLRELLRRARRTTPALNTLATSAGVLA
ncbi:helix-turn-helix domain-containing protein [Microlunatus parietis]|uniref:Transcriptional regulator with XRE-family HTH domain n=1 Tax=Microlunatus parietis TaxID=682979 RepID=A0A7Y9I8F3_9ACTN|nr:helix-turn-helix domain-containing protein [Microlunatus parietis]NYE71901.1 transcriptional regulator with XRE-family HTH domain [Microlunatus parietis]